MITVILRASYQFWYTQIKEPDYRSLNITTYTIFTAELLTTKQKENNL